jgi:hypothetical protein
LCVAAILDDPELGLDSCQLKLAQNVLQQWGVVKRYYCQPGSDPAVFLPADVVELRAVFDDVYVTATTVRIFRPILPHRRENEQRDEERIHDLRLFCDATLREIERLEKIGFVAVERELFGRLQDHCKNLLAVVLSERQMAHFVAAYDRAIHNTCEVNSLFRATAQ